MNRDYEAALDQLRFSREAKDRMVENLMHAEQPRTAQPKRRRLSRGLVIALAAALALAVGAGASGVLKTAADAFSALLGGSAAQTEIIDKIGRPIGAGDTDNGVTITADAIIGDSYNNAVVYSISRDDGAAFDLEANEDGKLPLGFYRATLPLSGSEGGTHGTAWFFDADPADNAVQYVGLSSGNVLRRGAVTVKFQDLKIWNGERYEPLVRGEWKLKFDMDYEDVSVSLPAGQRIDVNGLETRIDGVTVSPIGLWVRLIADDPLLGPDAGPGDSTSEMQEQLELLDDLPILLTKTDGSTLDLTEKFGALYEYDKGKVFCTRSEVLDEIIPLEEMASLTIGGVEFPVG